jgi:hypothetical protein
MVERGISQRRACALLGIARSALRCEARLPAKDAAVTDRMKHHSARHPRFGYRRIHVYLKREGYMRTVGQEVPPKAASTLPPGDARQDGGRIQFLGGSALELSLFGNGFE